MALVSIADGAVVRRLDNPPLYREAAAPQPLPPPALKLGNQRTGHGGEQQQEPGHSQHPGLAAAHGDGNDISQPENQHEENGQRGQHNGDDLQPAGRAARVHKVVGVEVHGQYPSLTMVQAPS